MTMRYINLDVESTERYDLAKFMDFNNNCYDILTSYFISELTKLEPKGVYEVVEELERPDLISYKIYGSVRFWSLLMMYNSIISPLDIKVGTLINYPSLEDLENVYFSLKSKGVS